MAKFLQPKHLNILVTNRIHMVTSDETTVKISKWLIDEVDKYINKNNRNQSDFPSKRNFVDRAVMLLLEQRGIDLATK